MATTKRTVAHALFDYTRRTTAQRVIEGEIKTVTFPYVATALRGETIEVEPEDLERGEEIGALVDGPLAVPNVEVAAPITPEVAGGSEPAPLPEAHGGHIEPVDAAVAVPAAPGEPERPFQTSAKALWVDYVVAKAELEGDTSMTRARAEGMKRDELVAWQPTPAQG